MYQQVKQTVQRCVSRLNNIFARGILNTITPANQPTAKVSLLDQETYDGIEYGQDWGLISRPPEDGNTEILVAFIGGQRDQGLVLRSVNRAKSFLQNSGVTLQAGETAIYNSVAKSYLHFKADGTVLMNSTVNGTFIKLNADGSIAISSTSKSLTIDTPSVTMTGNLTVNGDVLDNASGAHVNTHKIRDMRGIFNSHVHSGVAIGASNSGASTTTQ